MGWARAGGPRFARAGRRGSAKPHLQVAGANDADASGDIVWVDVDDGALAAHVDAPDPMLRAPVGGERRLDLPN